MRVCVCVRVCVRVFLCVCVCLICIYIQHTTTPSWSLKGPELPGPSTKLDCNSSLPLISVLIFVVSVFHSSLCDPIFYKSVVKSLASIASCQQCATNKRNTTFLLQTEMFQELGKDYVSNLNYSHLELDLKGPAAVRSGRRRWRMLRSSSSSSTLSSAEGRHPTSSLRFPNIFFCCGC